MSESRLSEIRLIGIHENGEHLTLESPEGTQFLLPIDQNLRTSISKARRAQPARGFNGSGTYGPREIQARFRQGATVEEIADESGWTADRVRRYEWPIIAERAHTITAARSVLISSTQSDNTAKTLDDFIAEVAHKYGFADAPADWNTFQQESGSWTISVDFSFPDGVEENFPRGVVFPARWSYNPANQSIYASNESAYFLMNRDHSVDAPLPGIGRHEEPQTADHEEAEQQAQKSAQTPQPEQQAQAPSSASPLGASGARNFNSARERKLADLLERARRAPVSNEPTATAQESAEPTSNETSAPAKDSVSEASHPESPAPFATARIPSAPQETVQQPQNGIPEHSQEPAQPQNAVEEQESTQQDNAATQNQTSPQHEEPTQNQDSQQPDEAQQQGSDSDSSAEETKAPQRTNRPKRTSVPSWDDIIFGNNRK